MVASGAAGGDDAVSVLVAELNDPDINSRHAAMRRLHSTDTARNCSRDDRIAAFAAAARKHDRRIWPQRAYAPARSEYPNWRSHHLPAHASIGFDGGRLTGRPRLISYRVNAAKLNHFGRPEASPHSQLLERQGSRKYYCGRTTDYVKPPMRGCLCGSYHTVHNCAKHSLTSYFELDDFELDDQGDQSIPISVTSSSRGSAAAVHGLHSTR